MVGVLDVDTPHGPARVHLHAADEPAGALVLGHGAGGGVAARDLVAATQAARAIGVSVALVEQPYRVAGRRSPAPARQLDAAWIAVVEHLRAGPLGDLALVVGGRSSGARVACRTAAQTGAVGVLCLAFPVHPPGRPEKTRLPELDAVAVPTLVVQGAGDPFPGCAAAAGAGRRARVSLSRGPGATRCDSLGSCATSRPRSACGRSPARRWWTPGAAGLGAQAVVPAYAVAIEDVRGELVPARRRSAAVAAAGPAPRTLRQHSRRPGLRPAHGQREARGRGVRTGGPRPGGTCPRPGFDVVGRTSGRPPRDPFHRVDMGGAPSRDRRRLLGRVLSTASRYLPRGRVRCAARGRCPRGRRRLVVRPRTAGLGPAAGRGASASTLPEGEVLGLPQPTAG